MEQSRKLYYYKKYNNNPNKKKYESEKGHVLSKVHDPLKPILVFLCLLPLPLAVAIGWVATESDSLFCLFSPNGSFFCCIITLLVGIINLIMIPCAPLLVWEKLIERERKLGKEKLEKLKTKYNIDFDLDECDVFRFGCGEIDDEGNLICSATRQPLSYNEYNNYCQTPGNCKYCARMLNAAIAPDASDYMKVRKR